MQIKQVSVNDIIPNDYNPNKMRDKDYGTLVNNIKKYGMLQPILVRPAEGQVLGYIIIDGFHRWKASKEARLESIWAVIVETAEEEAKLKTVSFNSIRGSNDKEMLAELMEELTNYFSVDDIILETGYDYNEIKDLFVMADKDLSMFEELEKDVFMERTEEAEGQEESSNEKDDKNITVSSVFGSTSINEKYKEMIHGLCEEIRGRVEGVDEKYPYTSIICMAMEAGLERGIDEEDIERYLGEVEI